MDKDQAWRQETVETARRAITDSDEATANARRVRHNARVAVKRAEDLVKAIRARRSQNSTHPPETSSGC